MYSLFNALANDLFDDFCPSTRNCSCMRTDVHKKDGLYVLTTELPGYKKENIDISIENGYLKIDAKNEISKEEKDSKGEVLRKERCYGSCSRSFYVGEHIAPSDIKAKFENGILEITLPAEKEKEEIKEKINII